MPNPGVEMVAVEPNPGVVNDIPNPFFVRRATSSTTTPSMPMEEKGDNGGTQKEGTRSPPLAQPFTPPMPTAAGMGMAKTAAGVGAAMVVPTATVLPTTPVAATRALFSSMDGATDRQIKTALVVGAGQVLGGTLILDKATVIAEGGAKRVQLMEMGREWPNIEFGGLLSAMAD